MAKHVICCGARGRNGDGDGMEGKVWDGGNGDCCIRDRGKSRGLLSQLCGLKVLQARGYSDVKVDMRMHLAGREGAGEKQLQQSPRALF